MNFRPNVTSFQSTIAVVGCDDECGLAVESPATAQHSFAATWR